MEEEITYVMVEEAIVRHLFNRDRTKYVYPITIGDAVLIANGVSLADKVSDIDAMFDTLIIEEAFKTVFPNVTDTTAMSRDDILKALSTEWNGESSDDITAMSANEVQEAIDTKWNGESSSDSTALSSTDIDYALNT